MKCISYHTKSCCNACITIASNIGITDIEDFQLYSNETRQEDLTASNSSKLNGFATKIRTMESVTLATVTLKANED